MIILRGNYQNEVSHRMSPALKCVHTVALDNTVVFTLTEVASFAVSSASRRGETTGSRDGGEPGSKICAAKPGPKRNLIRASVCQTRLRRHLRTRRRIRQSVSPLCTAHSPLAPVDGQQTGSLELQSAPSTGMSIHISVDHHRLHLRYKYRYDVMQTAL